MSITVMGIENDIDHFREEIFVDDLIFNPSGGGYGDLDFLWEIFFTDNDTRGITVTAQPTEFTVGESGTLSIKLDTDPLGMATTVNLTSSDPTLNTAAVTFAAGEWNTAKSVTVTASDDDLDNSADVSTTDITLVGSGTEYEGITTTTTIDVRDDDTRSINVVTKPTTLAEGASGFINVTLGSEPTGPVTVALSFTGFTFSPSMHSFNAGSWRTLMRVDITAIDNHVDSTNNTVVTDVVLTASGGDYGIVTETVSIGVDDDDTAGLGLQPHAMVVTVRESTGSSPFLISLTSEPTSNVTVTITSDDTTVATVGTSPLAFMPSNWEVAQSSSSRL